LVREDDDIVFAGISLNWKRPI